jgi:hypothetical protein
LRTQNLVRHSRNNKKTLTISPGFFAINRKNKSTPTPVTQTSLFEGSLTPEIAFSERNRTNVIIAMID